jgi:hypothetical protein
MKHSSENYRRKFKWADGGNKKKKKGKLVFLTSSVVLALSFTLKLN